MLIYRNFQETLFEVDKNGRQRNYSVKAYVIGDFLDKNVTVERDGFTISKDEGELLSSVSEKSIEREAAYVVKNKFLKRCLAVLKKRDKELRTM